MSCTGGPSSTPSPAGSAARVGDALTVEQAPEQLHRFGEPRLARPRRVEGRADRRVLGERVAGADAELHPATAEAVDVGHRARGARGVEVVVHDERTEPDPFGRDGDRAQRHQRRHQPGTDVVERVHDVEAGRLRPARDAVAGGRPAAAAARTGTVRSVTPPRRRVAVGPGCGGLELGREPEQDVLPTERRDQLYTDRQAVAARAERQRDRGLPGEVERHGEGGEPAGVEQLRERVGRGGVDPAEQHRRLGHRRQHHHVEVGEPGGEPRA